MFYPIAATFVFVAVMVGTLFGYVLVIDMVMYRPEVVKCLM